MPGKMDRFKDLAKALVSPKAPNVQAEMEKRRKKLDKLKNLGGMFDVIYKGRRLREEELKRIDD